MERIVIFGKVVKGVEEASSFTEVPWVKEQFVSKLGFMPYPGTFNLEVQDEESLMRWMEAKKREGTRIPPEEDRFCSARCYRVIVADRIEGAAVVPEVPGYPDSKLEIIAPCRIRDNLQLVDGDQVKVEILFGKS